MGFYYLTLSTLGGVLRSTRVWIHPTGPPGDLLGLRTPGQRDIEALYLTPYGGIFCAAPGRVSFIDHSRTGTVET